MFVASIISQRKYMSNPNHPTSEKEAKLPPPPNAPQAGDVENQTPNAPQAGDVENQTPSAAGMGYGVRAIEKRWSREDLLKRVSLGLRGLGCLSSFLAFIIMVSNKHGTGAGVDQDGEVYVLVEDFNKYEEYSYVVAIGIISMVYTGVQAVRQFYELSNGKVQSLSKRSLQLINFCCDQILAYLLISATSSAIPSTDRLKKFGDSGFPESSAAAISMEFLAFLVLAVSALISGYELSNQSYI
uniref:CASP-like protein n=1 Tax=Davidia involucrata TaxID=16924 RepID=A0A5B7CEY5_DAVIN